MSLVPGSTVRAAAVQLQPVIGDVDANLAECERLALAAVADGARIVALPEFLTTGMANDARLHACALPVNGQAATLLVDIARRAGGLACGSFLCADADGEVRNVFLLAGPEGVEGRHDKDLPTMWENRFYTGGHDDGVIEAASGLRVGSALCWEFIRSQTARRMAGRVDVVLGGSCWWSVPAWPPRAVTSRWERANARNAVAAAPKLAPLVGAPVVHAAHCGPLACPMPGIALRYSGHLEGGATISDRGGRVLAARSAADGPGHVIAEIEVAGGAPAAPVPDAYWLCARGPLPALAWNYQRALGRRQYARRRALTPR